MRLAELFPFWTGALEELARAVEGLEQSQLHWLPVGGKNSIYWLCEHIIEVAQRDVEAGLAGRTKTPARATDGASLAAELRRLAQVTGEFLQHTCIGHWNAKDPSRRPVHDSLWNALIELLHHRGQVFLLLRLQGRVPPGI
ncbi:MAG: DinB family protein [Bacillota bacterium]